MWNFGWESVWTGLAIFGMFLFAVLIVLVIVLLIRWLRNSANSSAGQPPEKSPLEVLKDRYARGEINREEFERKKREIAE